MADARLALTLLMKLLILSNECTAFVFESALKSENVDFVESIKKLEIVRVLVFPFVFRLYRFFVFSIDMCYLRLGMYASSLKELLRHIAIFNPPLLTSTLN